MFVNFLLTIQVNQIIIYTVYKERCIFGQE